MVLSIELFHIILRAEIARLLFPCWLLLASARQATWPFVLFYGWKPCTELHRVLVAFIFMGVVNLRAEVAYPYFKH